jgi:Ca2+-binding EF-hand superfamily protein
MSRLITSALAALLLSAPEPGPKDKPSSAAHFSFKSFDHDGDGKITREEFSDTFARLDRNHDGVLTPDEMSGQPSHAPKDKQGKPRPGKSKRKH